MSQRWRALARALAPAVRGPCSSSAGGGAAAAFSLLHAQALPPPSTINPIAAAATSASRFSSPSSRSFSADAAAVAPPPPDDPPPPPPPTGDKNDDESEEAEKRRARDAAFASAEPDEDDFGPDSSLTPSEIVARLDRHIIGQPDAKRAVANALRSRWRRRRVAREDLRTEIVPKNILMIGPTGCGKTEVARRLAKLADAPFVKVEATKFTEVGFHGRDVDSIIRDLVDASVLRTRERARERLRRRISAAVEDRILAALCGEGAGKATVDAFRELYRSGALDERKVSIELPGSLGALGGLGVGGGVGGIGGLGGSSAGCGFGGLGGAGGSGRTPSSPSSSTSSPLGGGLDATPGAIAVQEMIIRVDKLLGGSGGGGGRRGGSGGGASGEGRREMRVADARALVEEAEAERLISPEAVAREAVASAESDGIVFIDEIDKIVVNHETRYGGGSGADASSEGVQRDLLPIIEGSVVATKHGNVSTDHMLFICSGAFSACKPSDMLAELQGRLPIRVELRALTAEDFYRILTEPAASMLEQQRALIATEGVELRFTDGAARAIAEAAAEANAALDNIGARRLHTVLERVLEHVSFDAPETAAKARADAQAARASAAGGEGAADPSPSAPVAVIEVDEEFVKERMGDLLQRQDLSRYVL